jgi:hypothetical protein
MREYESMMGEEEEEEEEEEQEEEEQEEEEQQEEEVDFCFFDLVGFDFFLREYEGV